MGLKLDVGSGPGRHGADWTTVDYYCQADLRAQMWDLPVPDGSVDEIWSSHVLEHIPLERVVPTLTEWLRVLRPGGFATIQVPNLDYVCRYWLQHPGETWALQIIFGNQADDGQFHKTGWNPTTLREVLEATGFEVDPIEVVWGYDQETLKARVRRPTS